VSEKYDIKKELRDLYAARAGDWHEIEVPVQQFLMVDGEGDPNTAPSYAAAVEALYGLSYAIKFASKASGRDFVVAPLEGLWTSDDPGSFIRDDRTQWRWTMMIAQPHWITAADVDSARLAKGITAPRLESLDEGRSLQVLHVGPYSAEAPTLARLHDEVMPARSLTFAGPHHEVYLGDPRRVAPEKLRTVLRQPVRAVS
jgi:hypothetical protein